VSRELEADADAVPEEEREVPEVRGSASVDVPLIPVDGTETSVSREVEEEAAAVPDAVT
jgi:hypothetical protein